jgi:formamidopyrimidine-DNA glycosylase
MIELPEVVTIARQMDTELRGKEIVEATRGATPHKFAWYSGTQEEYNNWLIGKKVGEAQARGGYIVAAVEPDYALLFGDMGGRLLYQREVKDAPAKHQLLLRFADDSCFTVTIQMWGFIQVMKMSEVAQHKYAHRMGLTPLEDAFTYEHFQKLLADPEELEKKSVKYFMISRPGIPGVGNGVLHDILFRAKLHPRHRILDLTEEQKRAFYQATRETLKQMTEQGGRDIERDLYGNPGGYQTILNSAAKDLPCPVCGALIEKIQYLGGAAYFCPKCQV